jgi:hypothetical protein
MSEQRKARRYDQQAINRAFQLFIQNNGRNHERIAAAMRRDYPWFGVETIRKWAAKYAWDEALRLKIVADKKAALTSADELSDEVETIRKHLFEQISKGGYSDEELIKLHEKYVARSVEVLIKVKEARDTLGGFVAMYERLLEWLPDYSPHALEALLQVNEQMLERAAEEYGASDSTERADDPRED